ncbi:DUF6046 domain-containing protein [Leptospira weilii]|uniref:DUF6046 domain-containing protein n=1 Tax=Leptospira weilii TaxID=28184 RepID=UPI00077470AC|nr:DUF6046 domain-containing protein [Leptospira weilii]QDK23886.1 hypothetical protein FHG67_15050 [Leptospira weilii]QDK26477.1 hypothetical protein FHG68_07210 [Leptospira weilii]UPY76748.1 DUF6046 domain-containing protein [Leptospira weilii]UPY79554.1 DUF6046 domain-containing protein [Leptospira weilii]UPY80286.1 DUF6046 domain-containing protein [Leptospira weilii]
MFLDPIPGGTFLAVTGSDLDPVKIGGYSCPRGTKVTISQEKNYSKTTVPGREGTIKEVVGFHDWQLTIEFEFVSNTGMQLGAISELRDIESKWMKMDSLEIVHPKINALGIMKVFLIRIEFPDEDRGFELPVRIEAISDDPSFDLETSPK